MDLFERLLAGTFGLGFVTGPPIKVASDDKTSVIFRAYKGQLKLREIAIQFYNETQGIKQDGMLTDEGQKHKIKELAKKTLEEVDKAKHTFLDPVKKKLGELEAQITPAATTEEQDVKDLLREIEVRRMLMELQPEQRTSIFLDAINQGDSVVYNAVMRAPAFAKIVIADDDTLNKMKEAWAIKQNPQIAGELEKVRDVYSTLSHNFKETTGGIESLGQLPKPATVFYGPDDKPENVLIE
jgi:hypothetical protein